MKGQQPRSEDLKSPPSVLPVVLPTAPPATPPFLWHSHSLSTRGPQNALSLSPLSSGLNSFLLSSGSWAFLS